MNYIEHLTLSIERTKYTESHFTGKDIYYKSLGITGIIMGRLPDTYTTVKHKIVRLQRYK